jgi:hypothetical protein
MKHSNNIKKIFYDVVIVILISKENNLFRLIQDIQSYAKSKYLIILYFDKTLDNETYKIAKILHDKKKVIVKKDYKVKNLADAYYRAYKFSCTFNANWVLSMVAGYRHLPRDIPKFLYFKNRKYDCIWGYRTSLSNKASTYRRFVSYFGHILSHFFLKLNLKDLTSGFFMIKKNIFKKELNKIDSFLSKNHFVETEIKYYLKSYSYAQVHIQYNSPNKIVPFFNIIDSIKVLFMLFLKKY